MRAENPRMLISHSSAEIFTDYIVEKIWSNRVTRTTVEYYVEWQDFPQQADWTWEPIDHLFGCIEKIARYEHRAQKMIKNFLVPIKTVNTQTTAVATNIAMASTQTTCCNLGACATVATETVNTQTTAEQTKTASVHSSVSTAVATTSDTPTEINKAIPVAELMCQQPEIDEAIPPTELLSQRLLKCSLCKYSTDRPSNLARHINTCMKQQKKRFTCQGCKKRFEEERYLLRHIRYKCKK